MDMDEAKAIMVKKLGGNYADLNVTHKALLADVMCDCDSGRCSRFLLWDMPTIMDFLNWVSHICGENYSNLEDGVRWALEDCYGGFV